jgi:tRNA threonylcarbamoyl adenosine modification protein YeaZ
MRENQLLLALDTATATASVALYDLDADLLLAETTWLARRRQTQELLATAQAMLRQQGIAPDRLAALAVTTGPGSFTGVRIAASAAKGIGLGLPAPPRVVGIPTLSVTAAPWLDAMGKLQPAPVVCAYIQAGRGRYNWCFFDPAEPLRRPTAAEHAAGATAEFAAALAARAPQLLWLVGELTPELAAAVKRLGHVLVMDAVSGMRRAGHLARLAAQHLAQGTADDLAALQPLYLQGPS